MSSSKMQDFDKLDIESHYDFKRKHEQEKEIERKNILHLTTLTDDGKQAYIFSLRIVDEEERFTCHLCEVVVMGQDHIKDHIESYKHQLKLKIPQHPRKIFSRFVINEEGEEKQPQEERSPLMIESALKHCTCPLIGLEYLIEIIDDRDSEPFYTCMLCDKKGDPRVAMAHMQSYNHRAKYLAIHFPTAYRKMMNCFPRNKDGRKCVYQTINNICEKIEDKYGRSKPMSLEKEVFDKKKEFYAKQIINSEHIRETNNVTFEEFVDIDLLNKVTKPMKAGEFSPMFMSKQPPRYDKRDMFKTDNDKPKTYLIEKDSLNIKRNNMNTSPISSLSSITSNESDIRTYRSRNKSRSRSYSRSPPRFRRNIPSSRDRNRDRDRDRDRYSRYLSPRRPSSRSIGRIRSSRSPSFKKYRRPSPPSLRSPSPKYTQGRFYNNKLTQKQKWVKYRAEMDSIEKEMLTLLKYYEKNPEKHPTYSVEWKKFWNRRYKELQSLGKDPSKHDFKAEWIQFWNKRMQQLHESDLKTKKEELKKKLDLHYEEKPLSSSALQPISDDDDDDIIVLSPPLNNMKPSENKKHYDFGSKRSLSPWEENDKEFKKSRTDILSRSRDRDRDKSQRRPQIKEYHSIKHDVNVVSVLRLLTAIENQLGSLGPKTNHLLSSAISLEKTALNASDKLLSDSNNIAFFETIKEKLIGQLMAGIVERQLQSATKSALQSLKELLSKAERFKLKEDLNSDKNKDSKEQEDENISIKDSSLSVIGEAIMINGIGAMDKEDFARHLASALAANGQLDIDQEPLEKLINAIINYEDPNTIPSNNNNKINTTSTTTTTTTTTTNNNNNNADKSSDNNNKSNNNNIKPNISSSPTKTLIQTIELDDYNKALEKMNSKDKKESLTEAEIVILLNKFKDMSKENQNALIQFLKVLEIKDTHKMNNLRAVIEDTPINYKFNETDGNDQEENSSGRLSPFSMRRGEANPSPSKRDPNDQKKLTFEDSDDDYSFEDIYSAASKNVEGNTPTNKPKTSQETKEPDKKKEKETIFEDKDKEKEKETTGKDSLTKKLNDDPIAVLKETKEMIANIMGQLPVKYIQKQNIASPKKETLVQKPPPKEEINIPTISVQYRVRNPVPRETNITTHYANQSTTQYSNYPATNYQYQNYMGQNQQFQTNPSYQNYNYYTLPPATGENSNNQQVQGYTDVNQYQFNYSYEIDPNAPPVYQFHQNPGFY